MLNFKPILPVFGLILLLLSPVIESKPKTIQASIGRFDPTNHGFEEFINNALEYNLYTTLGGNEYFELQTGLSYWSDEQTFAEEAYCLRSVYIPLRFAYQFHPSDKWAPFFGAGAGFHFLIEEYTKTELYWTVSYTAFSGVNYHLSDRFYITSEVAYSYGTFSGIDNLNVEGVSFRAGLGYKFKK